MISHKFYSCLRRPILKETNNAFIIKRYTSDMYTSAKLENGIKTITMCHSKSRNSLSIAMMKDLIKHLKEDSPDLRVIVIGAEGKVFSAGHNLKELSAKHGKTQQQTVFDLASQLMYSIIDCPVPVIAKVDGIAAAAGCQLVGQCDLAICTPKSVFSTPGVKFGIFCSTPGVALARNVQKSTALKMLFTGQPISSQEAKASGLVAEVTDNLDESVNKLCEDIKANSKPIIELGKQFYYKQIHFDVKKAYKLAGQKMVDNLQLSDSKEGIKSFIEKRHPKWSHSNK